MKPLQRWLILLHRYLGIPLSIMFVVWFVSGVVMMYTGGMPGISASEQLAQRPPLVPGEVRLGPSAALAAAGFEAPPGEVRLLSVLNRPAYRLSGGFGGAVTVFADSGELLDDVTDTAAAGIAAQYLRVEPSQVRFVTTRIEPDQWTLTLRGSLPMHEFAVDDGRGTRIYVSTATGDVELVTTRMQRFFAWIGVIPHWLYFTPLRLDQPLWYWTVVILSALGCVLATVGLILGITQFRRSKPFSLSKSVRYRGWMRWHYLTGVFFGVFALTWVFSGLMSMEPFAWTTANGLSVPRSALTGGPLQARAFAPLAEVAGAPAFAGGSIAEVAFVQVLGEPYYLVTRLPAAHGGDAVSERLHQPYPLALEVEAGRRLVHARTLASADVPFATQAIVEKIGEFADGANIARTLLLEEYDSYYYSRNGDAPLPVLRIEFDDPMRTWYYVDPAEARMLAQTHRFSRIERWLFNGLHSLDFRFWYDKRPLWDIGMIVLSLGALATSAIGLVLGLRRILPGLRS